ncbi:hypothetical protein, partial [Thiolapillus sp.]|uniref:hypothetical protein n=1 Tax=Thiolapillus sp. TaxID=2017437 RepID=UPI003AF94E31
MTASRGKSTARPFEWEAKGVTPILYEVPAGSHDHSALYQTLHAWADTYPGNFTAPLEIGLFLLHKV